MLIVSCKCCVISIKCLLINLSSCWLRMIFDAYCKISKNSDTRQICCNYPKSWTVWFYDKSNAPKRCRQNGKQCKPWSDCSVCLDLPVRKLGSLWYAMIPSVLLIMPPTSKKLMRHIGFGLSMHPSVHVSIHHAFWCMPYLMNCAC